MHSKNIKKFGCYALIAGLVLGGLVCSPWFTSSLLASSRYPVNPVVTASPVDGTIQSLKRESVIATLQPYKMETPEPYTIMTIRPIITGRPVVVTPNATETPIATKTPTPTPEPVIQPTSTPKPTSVPVTQSPSTSTHVTQPTSTPIPASEYTSKNTSVPSKAEPIVTEVIKQEGIIQRFYVGKKQYYVNDKKNEMDTAPVIKGGRTLMPIRYVSETFGAKVDWNGTDRKVTISFGQKLVELWIGKDAAIVDGSLRRLDVAPEIIGGRTVLPLRFVSENLGLKVIWDEDLKEIKITN